MLLPSRQAGGGSSRAQCGEPTSQASHGSSRSLRVVRGPALSLRVVQRIFDFADEVHKASRMPSYTASCDTMKRLKRVDEENQCIRLIMHGTDGIDMNVVEVGPFEQLEPIFATSELRFEATDCKVTSERVILL